ncbi:MAG: hypothetical protein EB832_05415 [Thaumarchaeota archaeon S14]|nr:MAG: hypothetical protein EB832_05415 [Thaumarchaeota archaeon S14]
MLASRPLHAGGGDLVASSLFEDGMEGDIKMQRKMAEANEAAIDHNSGVLKEKHRQNTGLIITAPMLFGYLMSMTAVFMVMAPGGA